MTPQARRELLSLLSALCDGELAAEGHDRLRQMLAGDAECRRVYLEYLDTHTRLLTRPEPAARQAPAKPAQGRLAQALRYAAVSAATAAVVLLVQLGWPAAATPNGSATAAAARPVQYVATLAQTSACQWDGLGEPWRVGRGLVPGELKLRSGVAEVRFDTGSELILEGPATLKIESAAAATLVSGKVVFRATATGTPFDLRTRESRLVDFGTEYAVRVGPEGEEIHVFDGEVERTVAGRSESLKAGSAKRYDAGAPGRATPLAPEGVRPRRDAGRGPRRPVAGLVAYDGFDYAGDALPAGRADGGTGWAGPWQVAFARPLPPDPAPKLFAPAGLTRSGASAPGVGGAFDFAGFTKAFRRLHAPVRLDEDAVYYLSYLFRRGGPSDDPTNAVAVLLWDSDDHHTQGNDGRKRLNVGVAGQPHELFTQVHGVGSRTPVPLAYGETYLMVAKIVASAWYPDQVFLRVYGPGEPVGAAEPSSWTVVGLPFESDLNFDWVQAHVNSHARQTLDELRLGTTWESVTAGWAAPAK